MKQPLQHVADDADAPHVRREVDRVKPHDFRRHELGRAEQHPRLAVRVILARQPEVDDLDSVTGATETQDILRLHAPQKILSRIDCVKTFLFVILLLCYV